MLPQNNFKTYSCNEHETYYYNKQHQCGWITCVLEIKEEIIWKEVINQLFLMSEAAKIETS